MSLRLRLVLSLAALAVATTSVACGVAYWSTRSRLYEELDRSIDEVRDLATGADRPGDRPGGGFQFGRDGRVPQAPSPGEALVQLERRTSELVFTTQFITADRVIVVYDGTSPQLPADDRDFAVAASGGDLRRDISYEGRDLRMLTTAMPNGGAIQVARDLTETNNVLGSLRTRYLALALAVSAAAAALGWLIANRVTRSLVRLTAAVELVSSTGAFDHEVDGAGSDETGRLASAFNKMLGALDRSKAQQQQLVQDAGHELRTPLTSIRTNVAVLRKHHRLTPAQMEQTVDDLSSELVELTTLVNEIVELATDGRDDEERQAVPLRSVIEHCAERLERRSRRTVALVADGSTVAGQPKALERVVNNLLDNAAKFDPSTAPIEVSVRVGMIRVRDHGPGIDPADLDHVFDRFYRATAARSTNGSGLGLAIVRDIVEAHGGSVRAANAQGGGAELTMQLPVSPK